MPTVQVTEELRLDSLCTVDDEGGAHCASKGGTEVGQSVYSRWRGCCSLCVSK